MARKATDQVTTIGIDIGKNSFDLIGLDGAGNIVLRRKLSRSQVIVRSWPKALGSRLYESVSARFGITAQSPQNRGVSRLSLWHFGKTRSRWWARQDSNLRQHRYERWVLTAELRARLRIQGSGIREQVSDDENGRRKAPV